MMVKFCTKCGNMHDNSGNLCSYCYSKEVKRAKERKSVLQRNKEKFTRFVGGEWVGNLSRHTEG